MFEPCHTAETRMPFTPQACIGRRSSRYSHMPAPAQTHTQKLDLPAVKHLASTLKLAKRLAIAGIKHSAEIRRARLSHAGGPQGAAQAPATDPRVGAGAAQPHAPTAADTAGAGIPLHPAPSPSVSGEASPTCPSPAVAPATQANAIRTHSREVSPSMMPDPDAWQTILRPSCMTRASQSDAALHETRTLVCPRPNRACKRSRGFYSILAALQEHEPDASTPGPALQSADRSAAGSTTCSPRCQRCQRALHQSQALPDARHRNGMRLPLFCCHVPRTACRPLLVDLLACRTRCQAQH